MTDTLRILDANLNRAREGVRACEEFARLVLEDARVSTLLKDIRRNLQAISTGVGENLLLAARDVANDAGARPQGDANRRSGPEDMARAGIKRAQEALRVIEETLYAQAPELAPEAASARYRAYEAEQQLFVAAPLRRVLQESPVMVVFSRALCRRPWRDVADSLIEAGARLFQVREKDAGDRALIGIFIELSARLQGTGAVIVNDRADLARAAQADGVHVGQDDLPCGDARRVVGHARLVGVSTHNPAEARTAEAEGADYIGLGAVFPTATKDVQYHATPELIRATLEAVKLPVFAIGGITPANVVQLGAMGVRHAAVSAGLLDTEDPAGAYHALAEALRKG